MQKGEIFKPFLDTFHFTTFASLTPFVKDNQQVSELTQASSIFIFELCGYDITTFTETKNCKKIVITLPPNFGFLLNVKKNFGTGI